MRTITSTPIRPETAFYAITDKITFNINKEPQFVKALKRHGFDINLLEKENIKNDDTEMYMDIMFIDYIKLKNYHKYVKINKGEIKTFKKRIKEIER